MTQAKHTPGPWNVNKQQADVLEGRLSIEAYGEYFIAQVDPSISQEANARLIAAAPTMRETLLKVQEVLRKRDNSDPLLLAVNAALLEGA